MTGVVVGITRSPDQFRPGATASVATPTCCSCCCCCVGTAVGFTVAVPLAVARLSPDPARPAPTRAGRPWGLGLVALAPLLGALLALPATLLVKALLVDTDPRNRWINYLVDARPDLAEGRPIFRPDPEAKDDTA